MSSPSGADKARTPASEILEQLRVQASPVDAAGLARYGIDPAGRLGVSVPAMRRIAKAAGKDHLLALELWATGVAEARIVASLVGDPQSLTEEQMEAWVADFDSWDVCDQVCGNLFEQSPLARRKIREWAERPEEFVKRAAFAMMAGLAWHDKRAPDEEFIGFLPLVVAAAGDERNFVKKAVNWALRNIGKRNRRLNEAAIQTAREIQRLDSRAARWIAADALRELQSEAVQRRVG